MIKNLKTTLLLIIIVISKLSFGQAIPTIEPTTNLIAPGVGPSLAPVVVPFELDAINNSNFSSYSPALSVTVSLRNQIYTGLTYSNISTGMVFGAAPSLSSGGTIQAVNQNNILDILGAYNGNGGPTSNMFTSNPTATGVNLGTGYDVDGNSFGTGVNSGVEIFTAAQVLFDQNQPKDGRYQFGELVITFSRPVKNPVIHVAGLGGSYRYLPFGQTDVPANYLNSYFSSELELQNTGLTSTLLSGNNIITLSGNNILNNAAKPNGGSTIVPGEVFDNYGAATGSIRINGTVTQLVYKVFLRGSALSDFNFSTQGSNVTCGSSTCPRNPFTGDQWYVSASLDKPTQQISGFVFNDIDGLADNNINQSGGMPNAPTNVGGTLFANLLDANGLVFASTPVSSDGSYLFDAVPNGSYNVQLSTNPGTQTSPAPATILPSGWVNTGEFNGNTAGSDGNVNGVSANIVVSASDPIKINTNFGIRVPSGGPLPISLVDFVAVKQPKVVDLNWQTFTEQNSSHFDVEFSKDGSDFKSIGKVNAAGNSSTIKNYTLVHLSPVNGVNYYRLKMVDVDGSFKYSAVRTIKFSSSTSIKIMPNPTADRVYITSNEGGVLQSVGLYSIDGRLLQQVTNFNLGKSIDLSNYAPSIYILRLIDKDGTTEVIRVVKK